MGELRPERMHEASFHVERKPDPQRATHSLKTHVCECGWSTKKRDSSLYGQPKALALALIQHRLDHLEGKVPDA